MRYNSDCDFDDNSTNNGLTVTDGCRQFGGPWSDPRLNQSTSRLNVTPGSRQIGRSAEWMKEKKKEWERGKALKWGKLLRIISNCCYAISFPFGCFCKIPRVETLSANHRDNHIRIPRATLGILPRCQNLSVSQPKSLAANTVLLISPNTSPGSSGNAWPGHVLDIKRNQWRRFLSAGEIERKGDPGW